MIGLLLFCLRRSSKTAKRPKPKLGIQLQFDTRIENDVYRPMYLYGFCYRFRIHLFASQTRHLRAYGTKSDKGHLTYLSATCRGKLRTGPRLASFSGMVKHTDTTTLLSVSHRQILEITSKVNFMKKMSSS